MRLQPTPRTASGVRAALLAFVLGMSACGGDGTGPGDGLSITTASLASGVQGVAYSEEIEATGGGGAYSWVVSSGALPAGISLSGTTGVVSGTPSGVGASTFTVQVTSGDGQTATRQLTLDVFAELSIETALLPNALETAPYSQALSAIGGDGSYTWTTVGGSLPAGLSLLAAGSIAGTPTAVQSGTFTVRVQSGDGQVAERELSIAVLGILVIGQSVPNAVEDTPYTHPMDAAGGDGTYNWSVVAGALPDGLSLDASSGILSGVPTTLGASDFTVEVSSGDGQTAQVELSIGVYAPLTIETSSLASGKQGVAYADALAATGGNGSYTWSVTPGALPDGLTLDAGSGSIMGTPTTIEQQSFSVVVESGDGQSAERDLSIDVSPLILLPEELCAQNPSTAYVTFADENLETTVRDMLGVSAETPLTCALVATLTGLNAGDAGITDLTGIQNLVGLQTTNLAGNSITDLAPLASMTQLEGLNLSNNPIGSLDPLSGLVKIYLLFAEGSQVSDITPLADLVALEHLELANNSIDDISVLASLPVLEVLDLHNNDITDVTTLSTVTGLTWLDLRSNSITDLSPLADLSALETLDLLSNSITDVSPLAGLASLSSLTVGSNALTDISALSALAGLTFLNVQNNSITDISAVSGMSVLEIFVAHGNDITDISPLGALGSLTRVALDSNGSLSDIQPLIDNPGIGSGDLVTLDATAVSCVDVDALSAKGVTVIHNCPTG